jgi:NADH-quinone oxidoreductase subunit N
MLLAAPELWVLVMACVILVVDLFLREERRGIIHLLALITLVFAAIMTLRRLPGQRGGLGGGVQRVLHPRPDG